MLRVMLDFWTAYRRLRKEHVPRAEVLAVETGASVWTVRAWDMTARRSKDKDHRRSPNQSHKAQLARLARSKGAPEEVAAALEPRS